MKNQITFVRPRIEPKGHFAYTARKSREVRQDTDNNNYVIQLRSVATRNMIRSNFKTQNLSHLQLT